MTFLHTLLSCFAGLVHISAAGTMWFLILGYLFTSMGFTYKDALILLVLGAISFVAGGCTLESLGDVLFLPIKLLSLKRDPYEIGY